MLDDLYPAAQSLEFWVGVDAHNLVVDPYAEITLLLKEIEELTRLGFWRNGDPESDKNRFPGAVVQDLLTD